MVYSKQPKLGVTQELFSRISESTTGYTFIPCVGSFISHTHTHTHIQRKTVYIIEVNAINVLITDLFLLCLFMCVFYNNLFQNMVCQASKGWSRHHNDM